MSEYVCDCYETEGFPDDSCPHPTRKREAFLDELTDSQLKFIFLAEQEREKMKNELMESQQNTSQTQQSF